ncbi:hypothetical protein K438DRAFT_663957 [Mycena galopus ATCC 62051]|nr:hypothetical protein K438DRAFT_663957 [Mycena galopus ATCC 62051]
MRVLTTRIKHAMARMIEWAALRAPLFTRALAIMRLRLPAYPVRNAHRSTPPVFRLLQQHASLASTCTRPMPSCKLSPVVGDRVLRDWALREVREGRRSLRRLPSCPMLRFAFASSRRERRSTSKSHSLVSCFSPPFQFYGFSSLVGARFVSRGHGGEALVSFRLHIPLSRPLSSSGPATRPVSPSIYGIDFSCYLSEMARTRP